MPPAASCSSIGKRVPIEVIEYDDHSNLDDVVRAEERLMTQDKVVFILPPWGTEFNLATAPLLSGCGYPDLVVTANNDRVPEFAKRLPNSFWFLGTAAAAAEAIVMRSPSCAPRARSAASWPC